VRLLVEVSKVIKILQFNQNGYHLDDEKQMEVFVKKVNEVLEFNIQSSVTWLQSSTVENHEPYTVLTAVIYRKW
jgi:hypothetical protein